MQLITLTSDYIKRLLLYLKNILPVSGRRRRCPRSPIRRRVEFALDAIADNSPKQEIRNFFYYPILKLESV